MNTTITLIISLAVYLTFTIITHRICAPKESEMDNFDKILVPIVALIWPLSWSFAIGLEIVGFFRRKIGNYQRKKRMARKQKQRAEHFKVREL